jgi:hypothetical protein
MDLVKMMTHLVGSNLYMDVTEGHKVFNVAFQVSVHEHD